MLLRKQSYIVINIDFSYFRDETFFLYLLILLLLFHRVLRENYETVINVEEIKPSVVLINYRSKLFFICNV